MSGFVFMSFLFICGVWFNVFGWKLMPETCFFCCARGWTSRVRRRILRASCGWSSNFHQKGVSPLIHSSNLKFLTVFSKSALNLLYFSWNGVFPVFFAWFLVGGPCKAVNKKSTSLNLCCNHTYFITQRSYFSKTTYKSKPDMSNPNGLLSQKLCNCLNQGRTLNSMLMRAAHWMAYFDLSKVNLPYTNVMKAFES